MLPWPLLNCLELVFEGSLPVGRSDRAKVELQLVVLTAVVKLLVEQAGLHITIVLVLLAGVFADVAGEFVIEDLANSEASVNANRLDRKHLDGPVAPKTRVPKPRRTMHEKPQPGDRASALDHRYQVMSFRVFNRAAQINLTWAENHPLVRNGQTTETVRLLGVQHNFLVNQKLVVQSQIVAVRIEAILTEGCDPNIGTLPSSDFFA